MTPSAARYIRINLNPIREHAIQTILKYTTRKGESYATHLAGEVNERGEIERVNLAKLAAIAQSLYNETGGNPRAILSKLQGEPSGIPAVMQAEAAYPLRMFPEQIKWLFYHRNTVIDLKGQCPAEREDSAEWKKRWPSLEYLATRLHAGIEGDDLTKANIYIPPPIESYLKLNLSPRS